MPTARPDETAAAARAGLSGASFAFAGVVVLLGDDRAPAGAVPLERVLAAPPRNRYGAGSCTGCRGCCSDSPLATVVQDLLSIAVYFTIATLLVV